MPPSDLLYRETNDVANKEPILEVCLPAIVWNRSYLLPRRDGFKEKKRWDSGDPGRRLALSEIKESIDAAVLSFLGCEIGRGFLVEPSLDENMILFTGAYSKKLIEAGGSNFDGARIEPLTSEQSLIVDADERALLLKGRYLDGGIPYDMSIRIHVRSNLFTLMIVASPIDGRPFDLRTAADFDDLTIGFWERYTSAVVEACWPQRNFSQKIFKNVFADSRGLLLSSRAVVEVDGPSRRWGGPLVARLTPILSPRDQQGCMATYVLDRKILSVTTFGNAPPTRAGSGRTPLTFIMCVRATSLEQNPDGWPRQLGFLLSRAHTVTTMRLAALIDIKLLRHASAELARVDDLKRWVRSQIALYEQNEEEAGFARKAMEKLRENFDAIPNDFLRKNTAGVGLTNRIEASRYYIREFWKHVEMLKMAPVDGHRSYDQSIERNIGITFEFIDRLGARYDRLLTERASIEQTFSSSQNHYTSTLIAEIQRNGEFILVGALVPYYLMGALTHIIGEHREKESLRIRMTESTWTMLNTAIWTTCVFTAIYRARFPKYKASTPKENDWKLSFYRATFVFIWLLTTIVLCVCISQLTRS